MKVSGTVEDEIACGSKELDLPLFRFPRWGKTGAGGFPPRRASCAPAKSAGTQSCGDSPRKRNFKALR
jgi:hypothetical protein